MRNSIDSKSRKLGPADKVTNVDATRYNTDAVRGVRQNPLIAELIKSKRIDMKRVAAMTEVLPGFAGKRSAQAHPMGEMSSADGEKRQTEFMADTILILLKEMAKRCSIAVLCKFRGRDGEGWEVGGGGAR